MTYQDDDIVNDLRKNTNPGTYGEALRFAAADEIERLRAALRRIADSVNNKNWRKPELVYEAITALADGTEQKPGD